MILRLMFATTRDVKNMNMGNKNDQLQRRMSSCSGDCSSCSMKGQCASGGVPDQMKEILRNVKESLETVEYKILVLSGKGGVGKSTVTYLLSKALSKLKTVGVLDLDISGPSLPILFNSYDPPLETGFGFQPNPVGPNLSLVSMQMLLRNEDDAIGLRGPAKSGYVLEFLQGFDWEESNMMVIDTPPGTSDEHLSIVSFMKDAGITGAIIVTTPEEIALADVRRELNFCKKCEVPVLGVVENMSSFACPSCHQTSSVYPRTTGGAQGLCDAENLPLLGQLPIDPSLIAGLIGEGHPLSDPVSQAVDEMVKKLIDILQIK